MADILLINIDSVIPNLALRKVERYHLDRGDNVIWDMALALNQVDKCYVSCIFPENRYKCLVFGGKALIGGSGYDMTIKLPPEIEAIKPRINWGFTTRGCIRNCYFCFVPKMEGKIRVEGDIYDIWDGKSREITLMDNNILALPEHFKMVCSQIRKENLRVDFNQGLDHRLLTEDLWQELQSLTFQHGVKRFSFDDIKQEKSVRKALDLMTNNGLGDWRSLWFLYVGERDTLETITKRMEIIHEYKQHSFVMRDRKVKDRREYRELYYWGISVRRLPNSEKGKQKVPYTV